MLTLGARIRRVHVRPHVVVLPHVSLVQRLDHLGVADMNRARRHVEALADEVVRGCGVSRERRCLPFLELSARCCEARFVLKVHQPRVGQVPAPDLDVGCITGGSITGGSRLE